jgi:hypothetical protein
MMTALLLVGAVAALVVLVFALLVIVDIVASGGPNRGRRR